MTSKELIAYCNPLSVFGKAPKSIGKLCHDSRLVEKGDSFIAIRGFQTDGHKFIDKAIEQGASVIITEDESIIRKDVLHIVVGDTRSLLSPLAQAYAGNPAEKLSIIGITGTNGKTTVATLVWQILQKLDKSAALLGTNAKIINNKTYDSKLTTADPIELACDMKQIVEAGCKYLVMEVSSHALHQKRVKGIEFEVAGFTNLSHDHLDYHKSMAEYAAAKKILFDSLSISSWAVVNADDDYAEYMTKSSPAKVLDFSFNNRGLISASIDSATAKQTTINVEGVSFTTPLIGEFNAKNIVQSLMICTALGFDGKTVVSVLKSCKGAEGRMERVQPVSANGDKPLVIVDYAHTPDALQNVASTLSQLKQPGQRLVIVFGCGGDRDKTKRPEMAKIAEEFGDEVYVTSDNPRTEDPTEIINDIIAGFSSNFTYKSIVSRKKAIHTAISESDENDIILIAGKGHETYQEIDGIRSHFDDREEARLALKEKNGHKSTREVI